MPRGWQRTRCQGLVVVAVDDVVCHARMVWLLGEHLLEHGARLELPRVGLVRELGGFVEGEGIEDRGLTVVRVAQGQLLHGFLIGEDTRLVVDRVEVAIVRVECGDPIPLARGRGAGGLGLLEGLPPLLQGRDIDRDQGVLSDAHRQAPVRHGAARLGLGDGGERFHGFRVEERVQQSDGPIELGLRRRTARDRKVHLPELLFRRMTSDHEGSTQPGRDAQHSHYRATSHDKPPSGARSPEGARLWVRYSLRASPACPPPITALRRVQLPQG